MKLLRVFNANSAPLFFTSLSSMAVTWVPALACCKKAAWELNKSEFKKKISFSNFDLQTISRYVLQLSSCSWSGHYSFVELQRPLLQPLLTLIWTPFAHTLLSLSRHHAGYTQHPLGPICTADLCDSLSLNWQQATFFLL